MLNTSGNDLIEKNVNIYKNVLKSIADFSMIVKDRFFILVVRQHSKLPQFNECWRRQKTTEPEFLNK